MNNDTPSIPNTVLPNDNARLTDSSSLPASSIRLSPVANTQENKVKDDSSSKPISDPQKPMDVDSGAVSSDSKNIDKIPKEISNLPSSDGSDSPEEKEIAQQFAAFNRYPKLKKWTELFLDKNNKATYGNRSESAMQAYDCKNRLVAGQIGFQNFKKLKGLATVFADDKGVTLEKLLDVAAARALTSENPRWWEMFAEVLGYTDPKGTPQMTVNNNTQTNIRVDGTEAKNFSAEFKRFLRQE